MLYVILLTVYSKFSVYTKNTLTWVYIYGDISSFISSFNSPFIANFVGIINASMSAKLMYIYYSIFLKPLPIFIMICFINYYIYFGWYWSHNVCNGEYMAILIFLYTVRLFLHFYQLINNTILNNINIVMHLVYEHTLTLSVQSKFFQVQYQVEWQTEYVAVTWLTYS